MTTRRTRFALGRLLMTRGVHGLVDDGRLGMDAILELIDRHHAGDWGEALDPDDAAINEAATRRGGRLMSAYMVRGVKLWIITEADRSATTVLLPEEY